MKKILERCIPGFIQKKRWFQAKGQAVKTISIDQVEGLPSDFGPDCFLCLFSVILQDGPKQRYALPFALVAKDQVPENEREKATLYDGAGLEKPGILIDAYWHDPFCHGILSLMKKHTSMFGGGGVLIGSSVKAALNKVDPGKTHIGRPSLEQSHTAVFVDEAFFLKMYRRLTIGKNPELEMGAFLTEAGFAHIAAVGGACEYQAVSGESMTLALLQKLVPGQGDAWEFSLRHLETWMKQSLERSAGENKDSLIGYLELMKLLGIRVGEMHRLLANPSSPPAFVPEPIEEIDLISWEELIAKDFFDLVPLLEQMVKTAKGSLKEDIKALIQKRQSFSEEVHGWSRDTLKATKTRYHGDLHLGQVLVSEGDVYIIDFEGEPGKTLHDRRQKHSPLKDVAGMVRSFSYAAHMVVRRMRNAVPALEAKLRESAEMWEKSVRASFLAGYHEGAAGASSLPQNPEAFEGLLRLLSLEKALYELRYELNNRPDWVEIPLAGILECLSEKE